MSGSFSLDWFDPAVKSSHSLQKGLDRVLLQEEAKLQFVRCLKLALAHPVPQSADRLTLLHAEIRRMSLTLQERLGMLTVDRPQAWFRHSPSIERATRATDLYEEPIFLRFEASRASSIRHLLPELWKQRQLSCDVYDPGASLWGRLLGFNRQLARINQLASPFSDIFLEELPEEIPDELRSPALLLFAKQVAELMQACQRELGACFERLWQASEAFLAKQHTQYVAECARQQQEQNEQRRQRQGADSGKDWASTSLDEALHFMNFRSLPDRDSLRQAYRTLAQRLHPDAGGSAEHFQRLSRHYETILKALGTKSARAPY